MKVDIAVELPRDREDARDLTVRIAVGIGAAADQICALFARRDQQLLGAGIIEQTFLRKHADFDVDRPGVVAPEPPHGLKSVEADARIDLDMRAHARGALQDRFFQRAAGAQIDVVLAEGALGRRHLGNRLRKRSVLRFAAIEDAGLVEMDMRLDKTGDDEPAGDVLRGASALDARMRSR